MCNPWGYGLAVNRAAFDAALIRGACSAGVSVLGDSEVRNAQRQSNSWTLAVHSGQTNYTLKAEYLVLATGSGRQKLVERTPVDKPAHFAFMARANVNIPEQRHTFHLEAGQDGWWYSLPDPDGGRFVGFCGHGDAFKRKKRPLQDTFIRQLVGMRLLGNGLAPDTLASAIIGRPAGPQSYDQVAGNWWVAVGDAAFVSDPLSGMGIEFAVESAKLAAKALLATNRESGLAEYNEAVKEYARYHRRVSAHYHATANPLMHPP
jgi:flavin-dependent dehydrogenase